MRKYLVLVSLTALAACGGGGPQTVGSSAPPPGAGGAGSGSGSTTTHSFVTPTEAKTYSAIGGVHSYQYSTDDRVPQGRQYNQLYAGNASTARNSSITITYDPRDAIFDLKITDTAAGVNNTLRFQDPAHRTDFGGAREPQDGTPDIANKQIQFLQAGGSAGPIVFDPAQSDTFPVGDAGASRDVSTFFYQKPGTTTNYVGYAGFVRNKTSVVGIDDGNGGTYLRQDNILERAAFAYGERTSNSAVPRTGTATYTGEMLATMVFNDKIDMQSNAPTYFQWIDGSAVTTVDFGANTFTSSVTGTVFAPTFDAYTTRDYTIQPGSIFNAAGSGQIDLVNAGGFVGQMNSASFTQGGTTTNVTIAGSSVDGAFYGPAGQEVGGGFRIVGGNPDERIDILGAFTGKKP
jgi:hypothetical protein